MPGPFLLLPWRFVFPIAYLRSPVASIEAGILPKLLHHLHCHARSKNVPKFVVTRRPKCSMSLEIVRARLPTDRRNAHEG